MSKKEAEFMEWFKLNVGKYLEHNEPSPVTKEAIKNIDKAVERIEGHVEKISDKLEKVYTKEEIDKKLEKKANSWVEKGIGSVLLSGATYIGIQILKLIKSVA